KEHIARSQSSDWDRLVNVYSIQGKSKISRKFNLTFQKRGVYPVGPVRLESGDPFGYYQTYSENNSQEYLTVYPEILTDINLEIPAEDPTGLHQAPHS